jgi:hypothetical protein
VAKTEFMLIGSPQMIRNALKKFSTKYFNWKQTNPTS